jgi:predicted DNA binding CopG/RHH family protein
MMKHIRVKLTEELHSKFKSKAAQNGMNMQKVLETYILEYTG